MLLKRVAMSESNGKAQPVEPGAVPVYLLAKEVAAMMRLSEKSIYRIVDADNTFPRIKIGGSLRFPKALLLKWLEQKAHVSRRRPPAAR
jgi:excisionase family DNA binding protein